ncbi:MAG: cohesin domain-containing protein [Candidatus Falkowbacteria bacterium]|nr:cohesin domain-containing protein [Candidatus Falkowbacteria bacterium]
MVPKKSLSKIINYFAVALVIVGFFSVVKSVKAVALRVDSTTRAVPVSGQLAANIFLDNVDTAVNAIAGEITFPDGLLELQTVSDGDSIINFWIERPQVVNGKVIFSGIIPGGYSGPSGSLFSLIFKAKTIGSGAVSISRAQVLLNDGKGGEATTTLVNLEFQNLPQTATTSAVIAKIDDQEKPENFMPIVATDSEIFFGKKFLVFATQDKGSGIDHYEVQEGDRAWQLAISPYLLQDQNLDKIIRVKAIDKNGNTLIVSLPAPPHVWYNSYWLIIISILLLGLVYFISRRVWRK